MNDIERIALELARELRIRIHDMGEDNPIPSYRASQPSNAKWLDMVSREDAPIIEAALREFRELCAKECTAHLDDCGSAGCHDSDAARIRQLGGE